MSTKQSKPNIDLGGYSGYRLKQSIEIDDEITRIGPNTPAGEYLRRYWHPVLGYNYRLTNIQAAIGVAQMERIESIISSKINIARLYEDRLKHIKELTLPPKAKWAKNVYWLYSIILNEDCKTSLNELIVYLKKRDIETRPFFSPIHKQPVYNTKQVLPVTEHVAAHGFSLPSSSGLKMKDIDHVAEAINHYFS